METKYLQKWFNLIKLKPIKERGKGKGLCSYVVPTQLVLMHILLSKTQITTQFKHQGNQLTMGSIDPFMGMFPTHNQVDESWGKFSIDGRHKNEF